MNEGSSFPKCRSSGGAPVFADIDGLCSMVDVKTHREDTAFNMPNLTSVQRLARLYEPDTDYFSLIIIKYRVEGLGCKSFRCVVCAH